MELTVRLRKQLRDFQLNVEFSTTGPLALLGASCEWLRICPLDWLVSFSVTP